MNSKVHQRCIRDLIVGVASAGMNAGASLAGAPVASRIDREKLSHVPAALYPVPRPVFSRGKYAARLGRYPESHRNTLGLMARFGRRADTERNTDTRPNHQHGPVTVRRQTAPPSAWWAWMGADGGGQEFSSRPGGEHFAVGGNVPTRKFGLTAPMAATPRKITNRRA